MSRPLTAFDDDVIRGLLTRHLPLDPTDFPAELHETTAFDLILRDLGEATEATEATEAIAEDSVSERLPEGLEGREPAE